MVLLCLFTLKNVTNDPDRRVQRHDGATFIDPTITNTHCFHCFPTRAASPRPPLPSPRLPSPTPPSLFHPGDVRILVHLKTPKAPKPHKCFLFSLLCFLCLFYERSCQSSPTLVRFRKEKARQLPKSDWWLRNNGTPCAILTASRTPDILVVVILCSFYSSDQGCFH